MALQNKVSVKESSTGKNHILYGFTGLEQYRQFVRQQYDVMNNHNKELVDYFDNVDYISRRVDKGWFGQSVTLEEMLGKITQFKNLDLLDRIYEKVSGKLPESVKSKLKEKKMNFNDLGGVFSMDRFMMSMFKKPAFYSVKLKQYVSPAEVYEKENKYLLKLDNSSIEVHEKLSTSNKNVYAFFPMIDNDKKSIEIVIVAGANANVKAEEMMYTGIAGILLAELCDKAGVKVKINVAIGSVNRSDEMYMALIPIKNYNAPIDRNVMALLTSDARIFRHDMFKGIVANYDKFEADCPESLGRLISEDEITEVLLEEKKELFESEKVFFTSGLFNESSVIKRIDSVLTELQ